MDVGEGDDAEKTQQLQILFTQAAQNPVHASRCHALALEEG
jgi:hypothetical protein